MTGPMGARYPDEEMRRFEWLEREQRRAYTEAEDEAAMERELARGDALAELAEHDLGQTMHR